MQPNNQERVYYTSSIWRNFPPSVSSSNSSGPLNSEEFNNRTRSFVYSEENENEVPDTVCPISLEVHQHGDLLCEITGCHHIFNQANLVNWFRRSHLCPVCRYNVRTDAPQPTSPQRNANTDSFDIETNTYFADILRSLQLEEEEELQNHEEDDIPDNVSVD